MIRSEITHYGDNEKNQFWRAPDHFGRPEKGNELIPEDEQKQMFEAAKDLSSSMIDRDQGEAISKELAILYPDKASKELMFSVKNLEGIASWGKGTLDNEARLFAAGAIDKSGELENLLRSAKPEELQVMFDDGLTKLEDLKKKIEDPRIDLRDKPMLWQEFSHQAARNLLLQPKRAEELDLDEDAIEGIEESIYRLRADAKGSSWAKHHDDPFHKVRSLAVRLEILKRADRTE